MVEHKTDDTNQVPESLRQPGLTPLWVSVRRALDRSGTQHRGSITRPTLNPVSRSVLQSLLRSDRKPPKRIDMGKLEDALIACGVGNNLCEALTLLGCPPSRNAALRRAERKRAADARATLYNAMESWQEPWALCWADNITRAGILKSCDDKAVEVLVGDTRRLLDRLNRCEGERLNRAAGVSAGVSRTELAASLYGSSHALDRGTKRAAAVTHALRLKMSDTLEHLYLKESDDAQESEDTQESDTRELKDIGELEDLNDRELWEMAGILHDRVSAPVLTWSIPVAGLSALDELITAASKASLPVHLSLMALSAFPVIVPHGTQVLVTENPRLVESAAERNLRCCVVSTNGNPTTSVTVLLRQMRDSGASIYYHGDFDSPGLNICRRMHEASCIPWKMNASDYENAIALAAETDVPLEVDTGKCGPTPWDPTLQKIFTDRRLIIHEEFVIDTVLDGFSALCQSTAGDSDPAD